MNKLRYVAPTLIVAAVAAAAGSAFGAQAKRVAFSATYAGTAVTQVTGNQVNYHASGTGTGTLVKKSKIAGVGIGDKSTPPCAPFNGPGSITSAAGKLKLKVLPTSRACAASEEDQDNIGLSGTVKVVGGTLKFKRARGTLHFSGHFVRSTGKFTLKVKGPLTY
jgi:hypothetical protein